jgi:hypothetical protein
MKIKRNTMKELDEIMENLGLGDHSHVVLGHPGRQIAVHGMEKQETSSHRHG